MLSKFELLASTGDTKDVTLPDGRIVRIRQMSAKARESIETLVFDAENRKSRALQLRERFVAASVVDELGQLVFTDADLNGISEISGVILDHLVEEIQEFNGLRKEDVDNLEKN